jgi:hypothetical protein
MDRVGFRTGADQLGEPIGDHRIMDDRSQPVGQQSGDLFGQQSAHHQDGRLKTGFPQSRPFPNGGYSEPRHTHP